MRKNFKKFLISLCALVCIGAVSLGVGKLTVVSAATETGEEITQNTDYFEMEDGAQVRKVPNSMGIRFVTNVGSEYLSNLESDGATVSFGTLVSKSGDVTTIKADDPTTYLADIPCTKSANYDENGNFQYTAAIVYDKTEAFSDAQWLAACKMELTGLAYVKVVKGEAQPQYYYAVANDTTRSMRAVANEAILQGEDESALKKYLGETVRNTGFEAYEIAEAVDGVVPMTLSGLGNSAYNQVYIGAKRVGTIAGNSVSFDAEKVEEMGLTLGEKYTLSFFDANSNVYSMKVMYVTDKLTTGTDMKVFNVGVEQTEHNKGYYILGNNIQSSKTNFDMDSSASGYQFHTKYGYGNNVINSIATATSTIKVGFAGTLDGQGYQWRIEGPGELGLFAYLGDGAVIKNISIESYGTQNIQNRNYVGNNVLAYAMDGTVKLDNVYIKVSHNAFSSNYNKSLLNTRGTNLYMNNVVVENTKHNAAVQGGVLFFADAGRGSLSSENYQNTRFNNVYVIAGTADDETTTDVDEKVVANMADWSGSKAENAIVAGNDLMSDTGATFQYNNVLRYVTMADLFATFTDENPNPLPWTWNGSALVWNS